ncbi:MAG TPA: tetratricopeptide repeat protein [Chloroflexota bacterium]
MADELPHNLPAPLSSFIGRAREIDDAKQLLATARLLTLVGAGGIGKTRLALEVCADLVRDYPEGVWLVELASLADAELVPQAVASVLGVPEEPGQGLVMTLAKTLRRQRLLLVLDNCEHLIDACARLVEQLLKACPDLRVLATSREAFEIPGEIAWSVPPLSPDEAEKLFVIRASVTQPAFVLRAADAPTLAEICRRLDGMPLAIELAAARVKVLGLDQILTRLEDRFRLLTGASRTAPARHQSLRGAIEWSFGLLSDPERELFAQLSVFAGGWTPEAAEAISSNVDESVLDLLARLVEKSFVVVEQTAEASVRHRLLETLREFAREQLATTEALSQTRARHAAFYLSLAEQAVPEIAGPDQARWLDRLEVERDNLRAVFEWSIEHADGEAAARLGASLWRFWERRGYFTEGRAWLERALERAHTAPPAVRTAALHGAGHLAWRQRDLDSAERLHTAALVLGRAEGDGAAVARALYGLARVAGSRGNYDVAVALAEESLIIQRRLGNRNEIALLLNVLGEIARSGGEYDRAGQLYEESLVLFRETGEGLGIQIELHNLGYVARHQGDDARAARLFAESLRLSRQFGIRMGVASCIGGLAGVAVAQRQPLVAARLFGAAEALREAINFPMEVVDRAELDRDLHALHSALDGPMLDAAWRQGRAMALDQASAEALAVAPLPSADHAAAAPPSPDMLTPREQEIAALIARGLTNRQIAEALVISKTTADRHVSNILAKLGMTTRAQVAAWMAR